MDVLQATHIHDNDIWINTISKFMNRKIYELFPYLRVDFCRS